MLWFVPLQQLLMRDCIQIFAGPIPSPYFFLAGEAKSCSGCGFLTQEFQGVEGFLHCCRHQALIELFMEDIGLRIAVFEPNLLEKRGIKLWLQLFIPVFIDNVSYFLFSADMWGIVRVTFQPFSSANVYYRLPH